MTAQPTLTPNGALSPLRAERGHFTPTPQRAASYLLEQPQTVLHRSITDVAEACGCAESSIIRLCRELGFKGFQDFKLALSADLVGRPLATKGQPETTRDVVTQARANIQAVLNETDAMLDLEGVDAAVALILGAKQILTVGQGASGITGHDLSYKLMRAGFPAFSLRSTRSWSLRRTAAKRSPSPTAASRR